MRPTRTGLVLRLKIRPGQDAFDFTASTDRLRHSFAMQGITSREIKSGVDRAADDRLRRPQAGPDARQGQSGKGCASRSHCGRTEQSHYRDYQEVPHALTLGATKSGQVRLPAAAWSRDSRRSMSPWSASTASEESNSPRSPAGSPPWPTTPTTRPSCWKPSWSGWPTRPGDPQRTAHQRGHPGRGDHSDIWGLPGRSAAGADRAPRRRGRGTGPLRHQGGEEAAGADRHRPGPPRSSSAVRPASTWRSAGSASAPNSARAPPCSAPSSPAASRTASTTKPPPRWRFGDISPDAVLATTQIPIERPGMAVAGDSSGGWVRIRTPYTTLRQAVTACNAARAPHPGTRRTRRVPAGPAGPCPGHRSRPRPATPATA